MMHPGMQRQFMMGWLSDRMSPPLWFRGCSSKPPALIATQWAISSTALDFEDFLDVVGRACHLSTSRMPCVGVGMSRESASSTWNSTTRLPQAHDQADPLHHPTHHVNSRGHASRPVSPQQIPPPSFPDRATQKTRPSLSPSSPATPQHHGLPTHLSPPRTHPASIVCCLHLGRA